MSCVCRHSRQICANCAYSELLPASEPQKPDNPTTAWLINRTEMPIASNVLNRLLVGPLAETIIEGLTEHPGFARSNLVGTLFAHWPLATQ
jgi:hypothetical protein